MKNKKIKIILVFIIINVFALFFINKIQNKHQIYLRNLMFSEIITDSEIVNQDILNKKISNNFKNEKKESLLPYLDKKVVSQLSFLKNQYLGNDLDYYMAVNILNYLGKNPSGKICGVESLGKVVFDVEKGIGCCSDYSKAWIFYAIYFDLTVREVNSLNHTTVEYYDNYLKKWIWLDPYNRSQIAFNNNLVNQFELRQLTLFEKAEIIKLSDGGNQVNLENYSGYSTSQLSVLMWRRGINFIDVEHWDSKLRNFKFPKPVRQLVLLITGILPTWIILTNDALGSYLRILKLAIYLLIIIYLLTNIYIILKIIIYFKYPKKIHNF